MAANEHEHNLVDDDEDQGPPAKKPRYTTQPTALSDNEAQMAATLSQPALNSESVGQAVGAMASAQDMDEEDEEGSTSNKASGHCNGSEHGDDDDGDAQADGDSFTAQNSGHRGWEFEDNGVRFAFFSFPFDVDLFLLVNH